ncbi:MAG: hypothetical protein EPO26_12615 [Chloroflexota bacterium]|nr:MAG: hypothetical protein EPO26_12615 [Chloroflexota bacterium]
MSRNPSDPFRKKRLDAAIDAVAVWAALFLTYISVGVLLAWKLIRALQSVLRLRGREPDG